MVSAILVFGFASCKKDKDAPGKSFKVRMTDSPGDFVQLNLQITSVDVYSQSQGWVNLSSQTQSVNVVSLTNGAEIELANATSVSVGTYTKVRVTFASQASVMLVGGGSSLSLSWTGGQQQVEIAIEAQVSGSVGANILLDFNVAQSVTEVGGAYFINPFISIVSDEFTGVKGKVNGTSSAMVKLHNGGNSYSTYINAAGNFMIKGMAPGTYTASIMAAGSLQVHEVDNVVISQGQITAMGDINL